MGSSRASTTSCRHRASGKLLRQSESIHLQCRGAGVALEVHRPWLSSPQPKVASLASIVTLMLLDLTALRRKQEFGAAVTKTTTSYMHCSRGSLSCIETYGVFKLCRLAALSLVPQPQGSASICRCAHKTHKNG